MKNKKGFTLVELLAVIVILAIIALIATPIILNVIEDAKKGAAKSSALGYLDAVEKQIAIDQMDSTKATFWTSKTTFTKADLDGRVQVKGKVPTSVSITISKGRITEYTIIIDGYKATPDSKGNIQVVKADGTDIPTEDDDIDEVVKTCTPVDVATPGTYTYGDEYSCDPGDGTARSFYVLEDGDNTSINETEAGKVSLIMIMSSTDNLSNVAWNETGANLETPVTAQSELNSIATGWTKVAVSLPSVNQIVQAEGQTTATDGMQLSWLAQGLLGVDGYWTTTATTVENSEYVWIVKSTAVDTGSLGLESDKARNNYYYARPVITVSKTDIG